MRHQYFPATLFTLLLVSAGWITIQSLPAQVGPVENTSAELEGQTCYRKLEFDAGSKGVSHHAVPLSRSTISLGSTIQTNGRRD
jgi:hypothetical protein